LTQKGPGNRSKEKIPFLLVLKLLVRREEIIDYYDYKKKRLKRLSNGPREIVIVFVRGGVTSPIKQTRTKLRRQERKGGEDCDEE